MTNYNDPLGGGPVGGAMIPAGRPAPVFSLFSIAAIICALLAVFNVVGTGLAFLLAIAAIVFGLLGMLEAILPNRRGGIVSFFAVGAGLLGIVIALFRLLGHAAGGGAGNP